MVHYRTSRFRKLTMWTADFEIKQAEDLQVEPSKNGAILLLLLFLLLLWWLQYNLYSGIKNCLHILLRLGATLDVSSGTNLPP
jgi:hypothetical protein